MKGFWRLMAYIKKYKTYVFLNILCNILMALFMVVSIPAIIPFFNILFQNDKTQVSQPEEALGFSNILEYAKFYFSDLIAQYGQDKALMYVCVIVVGLFFLKNLFRYLSLVFMAIIRNGMARDLRQNLFKKYVTLPLGFFSNERKGDLISRMASDVQEIEWSILNVLEVTFREPIVVIGSLGFMIYVSPSLTLFVFLLIIFTAVIIGGVSRSLKKRSSEAQTRLGNLVSQVEETLSGLRIIKGFNASKYQEEKFANENNSYRSIITRILWQKDLSSPLSEFLGISVVALLMWYGSRKVFASEIDAATFFAFLFAFYNVINPAKAFSTAYYKIQKGLAAVDRIDKILYTEDSIQEVSNAAKIESLKDQIKFEDVSFKYNEDGDLVLKNIDLEIRKGEVVALVGPSGSGKSTLVDLLPRFYDVLQGKILIDGKDLREYKIHDLRSLMGIVSQEAILFNDSIYNNIVFGLEGVSKSEVEEAAKVAHAHDFILETEQGYDTNIGDRGVKLSGGQRQRLTIARAILRNPPILILDEATSALDSESEKLVQSALGEVMKNRTAIVIAHRLSTIQHANRIVVIKDGEIIEQGSHDDLMNEKGEYNKFVALQAF